MGKIIGGGLPVGAVGGRRDLLAVTAATRPGFMPHSGTFNGNPLTMAAGVAAMRALDGATISVLDERAAQVAAAIAEAASAAQVPVVVTRAGSILHVHLQDSTPRRASEVVSNPEEVTALHLALLLEGVYAAPRGMLNLSSVMTDADIDRITGAYARALQRLRGAIDA
jgi:glutamate-1-semialdehyde 2,1-aminomutase